MFVAVNVNHTSSSAVPTQPAMPESVASVVVDDVVTPHNKSALTVVAIALVHSSFAGGEDAPATDISISNAVVWGVGQVETVKKYCVPAIRLIQPLDGFPAVLVAEATQVPISGQPSVTKSPT